MLYYITGGGAVNTFFAKKCHFFLAVFNKGAGGTRIKKCKKNQKNYRMRYKTVANCVR